MSFGLLLNAIVCFAIVLATFGFAVNLHQHKKSQKEESIPTVNALIAFWSLVGVLFLFAGLGTMAAYGNFTDIELNLYYAGALPFAFVTAPLVYFIIYIILGDTRISLGVSTVFLIFGGVYLIALFGYGIIGPTTTEWGSTFVTNSDIALSVYRSGLFIIPTSMILGLLLLILLRRIPKKLQNKIAFSLVDISLVFDFMLLDNIAPSGATQMAARIFIFIGVIVGNLVYFTPLSLDRDMENRLGISQTELLDFENEDE